MGGLAVLTGTRVMLLMWHLRIDATRQNELRARLEARRADEGGLKTGEDPA